MNPARLPPRDHVDAIIQRAFGSGIDDAGTWWDLGWRPATFPPALSDSSRPMPVACPAADAGHARHLILLSFPGTPLGVRDDDGGTIGYRVAPCRLCRTLWYEARQLRQIGRPRLTTTR